MDATVPISYPYQHLIRRVRRRLPLPVIFYVYLLFALPLSTQLAGFAWLMRDAGWGGIAEWTRLVWLIWSGIMGIALLLQIAWLGLALRSSSEGMRFVIALGPFTRHTLPQLLRQFCVIVATGSALYFGRVDLAVVASCGGNALSNGWHLVRSPGHTWREASRVLSSAVVALAILPGSPALFAGAVGVSLLLPLLFRSSLAALLREKRDLPQFLRHEQKECGRSPWQQLQTYCAAELWQEASQQYQQVQADPHIHRSVLMPSLVRIRVGRGQYGKVLKMMEQGEIEPLRVLLPAVRTYLHLGQQERAAELVAEARRKKNPDAALAMGELQEAAGNLEAALDWYERQAHSLRFHRHAATHRAVGRVLMRLGRYAAASRALEQVIRRDYFLRWEDVENLAECLRQQGKTVLAEKAEAALARCGERAKEPPLAQ